MVGKIVSQEYKEYTSDCHLVLTLRVVLSVTMTEVV